MEIANPKKVKLIKKVSNFCSIFYHTKKVEEKIDFEKAKEILIFDPSLIGDTIMIMPFLQVVKSNFKNAKITFLCASHAKTILKNTNLVDEFIICNGYKSFVSIKNIIKDFGHLKKVLKEINKKEYDIAIEPRGDFRYIFYMHYINAKRKISFNYSGGECFLTDVIPMPENYQTTHTTDDKLYLMKMLGAKIEKEDINPTLPITDEMKKMKEEFIKQNNLQDYKIIGIHPGAREKIRRFEKFDELLQKIYENSPKTAFIVYEGVNEEEAANKVVEGANKCGAKVFHMKSNLEEYFKRITFSDAIICNDSSAAHIANAYKIPTTVMYGPVNPEGVRPYNNTTATLNCITIPLKCKPCYSTEICPVGTYECFNNINIDDVAITVLKSIK
ncbi:MAG: glycosyltransferase family 9 protein [Clostridiaceae bacterium]|nr:glycosyltransferase family 9 protein [Clostridiaceae bacterium]